MNQKSRDLKIRIHHENDTTTQQCQEFLKQCINFISTNISIKQRVTLVFTFILLYFILFGGSGVDVQDGQPFLASPEEVDPLANVFPTEGDGMATAILLNWSRLENLKIIVKHLCRYSMFKEIIIWNNNVQVHLTDQIFAEVQCPKIRIYNSPGNMHFIARYIACTMATTEYCYFQDDDWIINHMRAFYANFLRFPHLVHTDTNADVYSLTNWKWCFFDDPVNLHVCFSWVGTGAFASRENVIRFLKMAAVTEMDPTEFAYGDMYFTTYMNQVPYQLENELTELPQEFAFSAGEGRIRNKIYMHRALIRLYDHLGKNTSPFEKLEHYPKIYQRDARSPCSNDRCLFLTNKHSFPDVKLFRYKPYINISESEQIHESYYKTQHFIEFPYSHAVDGKDWTAWKSKENIHANDYIGLDLLLQMHVPLTFHLVVDHKNEYFSAQSVEISNDGLNWVKQSSVPIDIHKVSRTSDGKKTPVISATFHIQNTGFRFVRVLSNRNFDFGYGVYDFSFHADMKSIQKKP